MPGAGFPCGSTQYRKTARKFHVPTFLVIDSGVPGGKVTAAPLLLVQNSHASRVDHQDFPDGTMQSEYKDEVADKGYGDSGKVHGGILQSNRVGRSRII